MTNTVIREDSGFDHTPDKLPVGWSWARVEEICEAVNGRAFKPAEWRESGVPIIRIQNLNDADAPFNYFQGTPDERHRVCPGDLLFAWSGTPGTSFGAHIWHGPEAVLNQHIFNIRFDRKRIDAKYFRYILNRNVAQYISHAHGGVGLAHITKGRFLSSYVPLAPLAQQRRIVEEIEKQLSRLDEAVANLKRVKANLKRYRAAVLKAAVEGRLVPTEAELARREGRSYEKGEHFLARILAERRAEWEKRAASRRKKAYAEPQPPDTSNLPGLPEGWLWVTVGQLSQLAQYGTSAKTEEAPNGIPVLRMGNIHEGRIVLHSLKYLPSGHTEFPQLLLAPGDILFNRTNSAELVGKGAVYKGVPRPCSFASYLIRIRLVGNCLPEAVAYFLNSVFGRAWIASVVSQQVGQANVNGTKLLSLVIPVPPFAEQRRIVAEVERRLSMADESEAQVEAGLRRAEGLRRAILKRAFEGNLG